MRIPRIHLAQPLPPGTRVLLDKAAAQHLHKVLRLRPGASVVLFNGDGHEHRGELLGGGEVQLVQSLTNQRESPLPVELAQGLCRGERMDLVLQKSCELGLAALRPLQTQRSEVRLAGERLERRLQHWQQVLASACEQSGRARLPELHAPATLPDWLANLPEASPGELRVVLDPEGDASLRTLPPPRRLLAVVGPEGGLDEREIALCHAAGFTRLRLGPRVLRTETAGPALLAAAQALWGDLGGEVAQVTE